MSSSEMLGQSKVETTNDKRNLTPRVTPITLQSLSCSHDVSEHPGQLGEEGILTLGFCRGGGAARAGEPVTGQFGNHPVPGGSAESATATATGENPQSPHDRQPSAAAALDLARPRVRAGLGCSIGQPAPSKQFTPSGQGPVAGAQWLAARVAAFASHFFISTSSSAVGGGECRWVQVALRQLP